MFFSVMIRNEVTPGLFPNWGDRGGSGCDKRVMGSIYINFFFFFVGTQNDVNPEPWVYCIMAFVSELVELAVGGGRVMGQSYFKYIKFRSQ